MDSQDAKRGPVQPIVRPEFPWSRDDVLRVLRHIAETRPYSEDGQSCDRCWYCGFPAGNADLEIRRGTDCTYILARDMLTGIPPNETDEGRGIPRPSPSDCSQSESGGDA